jgi:paraquat-inducible protein A
MADHKTLLPIALFVLAVSILAPLARLTGLTLILFGLQRGTAPARLANLMHMTDRVRPWAMLDVVLIGALITLTKVRDLASVTVGSGFYTLGILVVVLAILELTIDRRRLWQRILPAGDQTPGPDWYGCGDCGRVQPPAVQCVRCGYRLHRRKPDSLHRAAALVATGFILYLPANLYPVLTVISFGKGDPSTILDGVWQLAASADWPLAVIVFVASVAVPLLKLFGLAYLILSALGRSSRSLVGRTRLYRLIELVGRWSSLDIVVAALLTALVTLGNLAQINPGVGVLAFGGVVLSTMLATDLFDPRLIWDAAGENHG